MFNGLEMSIYNVGFFFWKTGTILSECPSQYISVLHCLMLYKIIILFLSVLFNLLYTSGIIYKDSQEFS